MRKPKEFSTDIRTIIDNLQSVDLMKKNELRAIELCVEKLSRLHKSFDIEIAIHYSSSPEASKDKEEDNGREVITPKQSNAFIQKQIEREYYIALNNKLSKMRRKFKKHPEITKKLGAIPLENEADAQEAAELLRLSRDGLQNLKDTDLTKRAELKKARKLAIETLRSELLKIKDSAQRGYQRTFIGDSILPPLRQRIWSVSVAENEVEIAQHHYAFYYSDLFPLKQEIQSNMVRWQGLGGKMHRALEDIEEALKAESQQNPQIAELFYKDTFEQLVLNIKKIVRKFTLEKPELAPRIKGATGIVFEPSLKITADKIFSFLEEIQSSGKSYQEKIIQWHQASLALKQDIVSMHTDNYMEYINHKLEDQKDLQHKFGEPQSVLEANEVTPQSKTRQAFKENFQPPYLSKNTAFIDKIARAIDKSEGATAPNKLRNVAQPIYRSLLAVEDRCVGYFKKRTDSHWFNIIEQARELSLIKSPEAAPILFLLQTYDAFLSAKIKMLDETIAQVEGRSKLFNSRSLAMVNEVIKLTQQEVLHLQGLDILKWNDDSAITRLWKITREKSDQTIEKNKAMEKKYFSRFFGLRKPEIHINFRWPSLRK